VGQSTNAGTLQIIDAATVSLTAVTLPPGCASVIPQALNGDFLSFRAAISPVVFGFRTVHATRAFFHDGPGSPAKSTFVINGQTVQQLGENEGGFAKVRFQNGGTGVPTTGFLLESDLVDTLVAGTSL
jgi:hypothetical protein